MFTTTPQPPRAVLFSDRHRCPDWRAALAAAPKGCGLILRDYDAAGRAALAHEMAAFCRRERRFFGIAGDHRLARHLGAAFHCPSYLLAHPLHHGRLTAHDTAAVHNPRELRRAFACGFKHVFISPVYATKSHEGAKELGIIRARALAQSARRLGIHAHALGGMTFARLHRLNGTDPAWEGFGAIEAFGRPA